MQSIAIQKLSFSYKNGPPVLQIPELQVAAGERVFLYGPSGSGKTTLLGLLGGVLAVREGSVRVLERELNGMGARERDSFRGSHLGFIFQMFNLIPYLSVLQNIMLPCRLSKERRGRLGGTSLEAAAREAAEHLGMGEFLNRSVMDLSVGQQQRTAAARALIGRPEIIIADEPTSALDADRREAFIQLLFENCKASGATVLFVSHDRSLASLFDRSISLPEINRV